VTRAEVISKFVSGEIR